MTSSLPVSASRYRRPNRLEADSVFAVHVEPGGQQTLRRGRGRRLRLFGAQTVEFRGGRGGAQERQRRGRERHLAGVGQYQRLGRHRRFNGGEEGDDTQHPPKTPAVGNNQHVDSLSRQTLRRAPIVSETLMPHHKLAPG